MNRQTDSQRWNARYRIQQPPGAVCEVLERYQSLLPATGTALDLACGLAGNAVLLARRGLTAYAWDVSDVVIDKVQRYARQQGLPLIAECRDLARIAHHPSTATNGGEQCGLPRPSVAQPLFDVIVVSYYLDRSLMPWIVQSLRPGGLLYYQTWLRADAAAEGELPGPANPAYRLSENELIALCHGLRVLVYREWSARQDSGSAAMTDATAFVVAEKRHKKMD